MRVYGFRPGERLLRRVVTRARPERPDLSIGTGHVRHDAPDGLDLLGGRTHGRAIVSVFGLSRLHIPLDVPLDGLEHEKRSFDGPICVLLGVSLGGDEIDVFVARGLPAQGKRSGHANFCPDTDKPLRHIRITTLRRGPHGCRQETIPARPLRITPHGYEIWLENDDGIQKFTMLPSSSIALVLGT